MKYLLAFICPPLAVACTGRIFLAFFNGLFWPPSLCLYLIVLIKGMVAFHVAPPTLLSGMTVLSFFWALDIFSFIWIIPTAHALFMVHGDVRERRHREQLRAQQQNALMMKGTLRQLRQAATAPRIVVIQQQPAPRAAAAPKVIHARELPPPQ